MTNRLPGNGDYIYVIHKLKPFHAYGSYSADKTTNIDMLITRKWTKFEPQQGWGAIWQGSFRGCAYWLILQYNGHIYRHPGSVTSHIRLVLRQGKLVIQTGTNVHRRQ